MKKRIISLVLVIIVLIMSVSLMSCSGSGPKLEDVKERFIYLIENSKELNTIYFGKGLPIYEREGILVLSLQIFSQVPSFSLLLLCCVCASSLSCANSL